MNLSSKVVLLKIERMKKELDSDNTIPSVWRSIMNDVMIQAESQIHHLEIMLSRYEDDFK